jgi:hypothetical protein
MVSQVEGILQASAGPADVVRALFPGGTVTGAPKVRTMQVIAELEPVARGYYTGSLGWIGASGDLCLNIIIRSLWSAEDRTFIQAGAGIVADSVPAREYAESMRKAQAPLLAAARAALSARARASMSVAARRSAALASALGPLGPCSLRQKGAASTARYAAGARPRRLRRRGARGP